MERLAIESTEIASIPRPMTEEEFEAWCDEDVRTEYVDGKVGEDGSVRGLWTWNLFCVKCYRNRHQRPYGSCRGPCVCGRPVRLRTRREP